MATSGIDDFEKDLEALLERLLSDTKSKAHFALNACAAVLFMGLACDKIAIRMAEKNAELARDSAKAQVPPV